MSAVIVFDLDGTLIDSAPDIRVAANAVLEQEALPQLSLEETRSFVGHGAGVFVRRMMAARGVDATPEDHARWLAVFLSHYEGAVSETQLYPGVRVALERLTAEGHRLGLCTNKPFGPTQIVLAHFGLTDQFGIVLGGDSLPVRKPDPAPLRACLDALGSGPVLYVGDSEVDAETAAAAGVPFALFTPGYRKTPIEELQHAFAFDDYADFLVALPDLLSQAAQG